MFLKTFLQRYNIFAALSWRRLPKPHDNNMICVPLAIWYLVIYLSKSCDPKLVCYRSHKPGRDQLSGKPRVDSYATVAIKYLAFHDKGLHVFPDKTFRSLAQIKEECCSLRAGWVTGKLCVVLMAGLRSVMCCYWYQEGILRYTPGMSLLLASLSPLLCSIFMIK